MLKIRTHLVGGMLIFVFSIILFFIIPIQIGEGFSVSSFAIGPRVFPYSIDIALAIFSLGLIFQSLVLKKDRVVEVNLKNELKILIYFLFIVVYVILIKLIGFLISSLLIGGVTLVYLKAKKWYYYLVVLLFTVALYFSFTLLLNVRLP